MDERKCSECGETIPPNSHGLTEESTGNLFCSLDCVTANSFARMRTIAAKVKSEAAEAAKEE